jgi:hypothetical protein
MRVEYMFIIFENKENIEDRTVTFSKENSMQPVKRKIKQIK